MPENNTIPGYTLIKGGVEIPSQLVYAVHVEFCFSELPKATIQINDGSWADQNFEQSEKTDWQIGEKLELKIGYNQQHETIFSGIIIKQGISASDSNTSKLVLELRHTYYLLAIKRNNRIFLEKKDNDVLEEILNEYRFSNEIDALSDLHPQMIQCNSTDWDFINLRAEANRMHVIPTNDTLIIKKGIIPEEEKLTLKFGTNITKFDLEIDSRHSFENYMSTTWDANDQEIISSEASVQVDSTVGTLDSDEIAAKNKHGDFQIVGFGSLQESEATNLADSKKENAELTKVRGTVKCLGNSGVKIGDWVKLEGLGSQFNGKVLVTGVLHELSAGRWYTTYQIGLNPEKYIERFDNIIEKPASGLLPGINGLQIGIVSKLESTDQDEKILVQLPNLVAGEDAVWARSARVDAGKDRGWVFRPEIGDEVILGFINDDPRQAIILGAMHSSANISPIEAKDDNHHKGYVSREELKLLFDDEKKIISILTPNTTVILDDDAKKVIIKNQSNEIELSEDGIKLDTQKDLKIKANGDIELEGMNVKIKANAQLEAEGSAGVKLSSTAITDIKGSLVNINS